MNQLTHEPSAYLKQHQDNPVNWMPYGPEAIRAAQENHKPIFLSIGYSTCHWCHVMAHESFEDEVTANYLNENFISIKVDKEEYPDLDNYFQIASQLYNGRGGWPLSVFLTPQMKPFFIGTYFPNKARGGMPSFMQVLEQLTQVYQNENATIQENAQKLTEAITKQEREVNKIEFNGHFPPASAIMNALKNFQDNEFGGYGQAPKFPHFSFFEWATEQILEGMLSQEQVNHVVESVEKMLCGGIYDHARGGIHRYSVDDMWLVPHFEKMLYDQSALLKVLSKLSLTHPSAIILDTIAQTLDYLKIEMQSEAGYFFAAQDADSEGKEGLYFTFTEEEFDNILKELPQELEVSSERIKQWFQISSEGNFEEGLNVISLNKDLREEFLNPQNWRTIQMVRALLLKERKGRIPPLTDNKGISSWNFMLLSALADTAQYANHPELRLMASSLLQSSLKGVHENFFRPLEEENGKMTIIQSTTKKKGRALFENFVQYTQSQFRLYELSAQPVYLENAKKCLDYIFGDFFQDNSFYTRSLELNSSEPFQNLKVELFDQSYKSPLATLISLIRKWHFIIERYEYLEKVQPIIEKAKHEVLNNPFGYGEALRALIYPQEAYKKIEVPASWCEKEDFQKMMTFFSARFAITYHQNADESWQICHHLGCELNGVGMDKFKRAFEEKGNADE